MSYRCGGKKSVIYRPLLENASFERLENVRYGILSDSQVLVAITSSVHLAAAAAVDRNPAAGPSRAHSSN